MSGDKFERNELRMYKKYLVACVFAMLMILLFIIPVYASDVRVMVNDEEVIWGEQTPVIVDGRTLVPVREVFEMLGFDVNWSIKARQATLISNHHTVILTIGSATFTTNGASHTLDIPVQIIADTTMIPLRAVIESIGYYLGWNAETRTVVILSARAPMVALTFDDGPSPHTNRILDVLERYNSSATFFVLGYRTERHRDTVVRAAGMGNEIAGHTWTHTDLTRLSVEEIRETIQSTSAMIEQITGSPSPRFYRPPFGSTNSTVRYVSAQLGYAIVNWTLDTLDWRFRNANTIYSTIMDEVVDGAVILLHDIHLTTAEAMELVIPSLIAQGFRLVTLSELMYHFYGELEPGRIYGRVYDDQNPNPM